MLLDNYPNNLFLLQMGPILFGLLQMAWVLHLVWSIRNGVYNLYGLLEMGSTSCMEM
jgi:hypothetical protein